jgi:NAD(P)-dependent dehydrogenase (short-subunit alcohol dehydrogenase family)
MNRYAEQVVALIGAENAFSAALADSFAQEGAIVERIDADRSDLASTQAALGEIARKHGRLDVMLTNVLLPMPPEAALGAAESTPEQWEAQQRRFYTLPAMAAVTAGRIMRAQGHGSIVHLGPVHGLFAQAERAAYCAAAAGLFMHTRALAVEWGALGIRVNAIACGVLPSDMAAPSPASDAALLSRIPMGRRAEYREVCEAALFLGGDEASFITGDVLRVDGGWTAYHLFFPFETAF